MHSLGAIRAATHIADHGVPLRLSQGDRVISAVANKGAAVEEDVDSPTCPRVIAMARMFCYMRSIDRRSGLVIELHQSRTGREFLLRSPENSSTWPNR